MAMGGLRIEITAHPANKMSACFCTLAIHPSYRERARLLCGDLAPAHLIVMTDEPADFADLPVHAIRHDPTGPMAVDYLEGMAATGNGRGAAAYHDKRFAVEAALREFDTAIFLDADSRVHRRPPPVNFEAGLAVLPVVQHSIAVHLATCGSWRLPAFQDLALELLGDTKRLFDAKWCHEACFAVTKNGSEDRFFWAWGQGASMLQRQKVFSGEGGVIGIAAAYAGWTVDFELLAPLAALIHHEGGGPK
jgi:hypothetical protein